MTVVSGIHSRGYAIMDIKPEHLILSPNGLFIVDYGCSYHVDSGRPLAFMLISPVLRPDCCQRNQHYKLEVGIRETLKQSKIITIKYQYVNSGAVEVGITGN